MFNKLIDFLNCLEDHKIYYKLNKVREDGIMVEIAIPDERWEIEFMTNEEIIVEKFLSNKDVRCENNLGNLFNIITDNLKT